MKGKILFLDQNNATNGLMAEAIFRHLFGTHWEVYSAGIISGGLHVLALNALAEREIEIKGLVSKALDELPRRGYDLLVTLSPELENTDLVKTKVWIHLPFEDPAKIGETHEQRADAFRRIRDQLFGRLNVLGYQSQPQIKTLDRAN